MKKVLITIFSLCVILVMTGCGKKADPEAGCYAPVGEDGIWYCTILDREQDGELGDQTKWMRKVLKDEGLTLCSSKLMGERVTEIKVPEAAKEQDGEYNITVHNIKGKETSKVKIVWVHFPDSEKKDELAFVAPKDYLNSEYHVEF